MSHYLKEHLDAVGELPKKLRETMASIGTLDDRCQKISEMIDRDVGEVARARKRYYENFEKGDSPPCNKSKKGRTRRGTEKSRPPQQIAPVEGPVPDGWRTPEIRTLEDEINSRIDLVLRMADEKWRLAQHAYDSLDINIRRLDSDLGRMETDLRRQGLLPPREAREATSRKRRGIGAKKDDPGSEWQSNDDLPVHPNEPTYCLCNQVSYGHMVGCDNSSCDNEGVERGREKFFVAWDASATELAALVHRFIIAGVALMTSHRACLAGTGAPTSCHRQPFEPKVDDYA
ncbi:unnamed protein product [Ascophyllum nodosum]